jgi:superfamily II DNA/RNA helicase
VLQQSMATTTSDNEPLLLFQAICLDEADRLATQTDLCRQVDALLEKLVGDHHVAAETDASSSPQLCLCSATLSAGARARWDEWLSRMPNHPKNSVLIQVGGMSSSSSHRSIPAEGWKTAGEEEGKEVLATMIAGSSSSSPTTATTTDHSSMFSRIPANLTQTLHVCSEHKKPRKLLATLQAIRQNLHSGLTLIFFNRIQTLQVTSLLLRKHQIQCLELHSQCSQAKRESVVKVFASGRISILLATDVAARGLHVDHLQNVIQYDFPSNLEQYIHRCGRAGRTTTSATSPKTTTTNTVYSFFTRNMAPLAKDLVSLLQATNQATDPNLLELAEKQGRKMKGERKSGDKADGNTDTVTAGGMSATNKRRKSNLLPAEESAAVKQAAKRSDAKPDTDDDDADSDASEAMAFFEQPGSRIVLKRAGNVSDASSDSGEVGDI